MGLSNTALAIDSEWDGNNLLEIGYTEVDLKNRRILKTKSIAIKPAIQIDSVNGGYSLPGISKEIEELTGWTNRKLFKQGVSRNEARRRLLNDGFANRLIIVDTDNEIQEISAGLFPTSIEGGSNCLNISTLYKLKTLNLENIGLDAMLISMGIEFEGQRHRANWDSLAIAKLFLKLT